MKPSSAARAADPAAVLLRENVGPIAVLTLNRPQVRNTLTEAMLAALELRHDNLLRAEELARDAIRQLRATKEHGFLVEAERTLAEVLVAQGRITEAERVAERLASALILPARICGSATAPCTTSRSTVPEIRSVIAGPAPR